MSRKRSGPVAEKFVPRPEPTLDERFAQCHESFRQKVADLAALAGKTWREVYGWWREYSATCRSWDQSAVWPEFLEWYKDKLGVAPEVTNPN